MKTQYFAITVISSGGFAIIAYLLFTIGVFDQIIFGSAKVWDIDTAQLANETASKYGIFTQQTIWTIHVSSNGKIYALDGNHKKYDYLNFTCLFPIIPNDGKEHFAYLSVFRSNNTAYVVVLDEYTLSVIDAKPIPYDTASCGP